MGFFDLFKASENKRLKEELYALQTKYDALEESSKEELSALQMKYDTLEASVPKEKKDFDAIQEEAASLKVEISRMNVEKTGLQEELEKLHQDVENIKSDFDAKQATLSKVILDIQKVQQLYEQYKAAVKGYEKNPDNSLQAVVVDDELLSVVEVDLNCMNVRELRNRYKQNQREIQKVFKRYEGRYTTKSNAAIYKLMVIAMEAELQNVLSTLSHGKLDKAIESIKAITQRYYEVAVEGNQSIASTIKNFIAEIEHLFIETIKVEYE